MPTPRITSDEIDFILRLADAMIPGNGAWPQPSATDLGRFIREHCGRDADIAALRNVVSAFRESGRPPVQFLEHHQRAAAKEFRVLIDFVYLGFYSRPEVVRAIQSECECDYISPPQPRGYHMPPEPDVKPSRRGRYTPTTDVKRVDMSRLAHRDYSQIG